MKYTAGFTAGRPEAAAGLFAYVPPVMLLIDFERVQRRSAPRSSLPPRSPRRLKPSPAVSIWSRMSAVHCRHGSIFALMLRSNTVLKHPPCTTVLPATPPMLDALLIAPEL